MFKVAIAATGWRETHCGLVSKPGTLYPRTFSTKFEAGLAVVSH